MIKNKKILFYGGITGGIIFILILAFLFVNALSETGSREGNAGGGGGFGSLFPFSQEEPPLPPLIEGENDEFVPTVEPPRLRKIADGPVVSVFPFASTTRAYFRYMEKETGNIYEGSVDHLNTTRVSKATLLGVKEALWFSKDALIVRILEGERIEDIPLTIGSAGQIFSESALTETYRSILMNSERKEAVGISERGVIVLIDEGGDTESLFTSPITSWIPHLNGARLFISSAPKSGEQGYLFEVRSGTPTKVAEDEGLLALVHPEAPYAVISRTDGNRMGALSLLHLNTGEMRWSTIGGMADKCAFTNIPTRVICAWSVDAPPAEYPNDWLLGRVSFFDDVWLIDFEEGTSDFIFSPGDDEGNGMDVYKPVVSGDGSYLFFLNKNDLSLWSYRLTDTDPPFSPEEE